MPAIIMPIYLVVFSVETKVILILGFGVSAAGLVCMKFLPESPKYLFSIEEY